MIQFRDTCLRGRKDYLSSDAPFRTDIVRKALKTRTVLIPEKLAIFGESVTYLEINKTRFLFFAWAFILFINFYAEANQNVMSNMPLLSKETTSIRYWLLALTAFLFLIEVLMFSSPPPPPPMGYSFILLGGKKYYESQLPLPRTQDKDECSIPTVRPLCLQETYIITRLKPNKTTLKQKCFLKPSESYSKKQNIYPSITTVKSKQFQGFLRYAYEWRTKPRAMILRNISDV